MPPTRAVRWLKDRFPELLAAAAGILWYVLIVGLETLLPTHLDWLGGGDRTQHLHGWLFFRLSPWALPLGDIRGFAWPVGTTVGFTDANPLIAVLAKLCSPLLPVDFQYLGPWMACCFALQGWFGARIAALGSDRWHDRLLGGVLFVLAPPLGARVGHAALCAHFGLLALLLLHLAPRADAAGARRSFRAAAAITWLLSSVHPYLAVMALGLALALVARLWLIDRAFERRSAAQSAGLLVFGQAAIFALLGYFTSAPAHSGKFGVFSADLLTLINPMHLGRLLPAFPTRLEQGDGLAYLGAGALALVVLAALLALRPRSRRSADAWIFVPAAAVSLLYFAFALASEITLAGRTVLDLHAVYRLLLPLVGPFRASGRFAWVLGYLLMALAISRLPRLVGNANLASGLLVVAVVVQAWDLSPMRSAFRARSHPWRLRDPAWELARDRYDHLAMIPDQVVGVWSTCRGPTYPNDNAWAPLAERAYSLGMTFNGGYLSRGSGDKLSRACDKLSADVEAGQFDPRTLYVVAPQELGHFATHRDRLTCGLLDGHAVCAASSSDDPFQHLLARSPTPFPPKPTSPPPLAGRPGAR